MRPLSRRSNRASASPAEGTLELLAHHCTEAALTEKAISYWSAAGEWASQRSATVEAVSHFRRAQALLETLEDGPEVREQQLKLIVALGPALITTQGGGTPEVEQIYRRAIELCAGLPSQRSISLRIGAGG